MLRGQMESNKIQSNPITICLHQVPRKTLSWLGMLPRRNSSLPREKNRGTANAAVTDGEAASGSALELPHLYPSDDPKRP